ncbi:hypothetical protein B0H63DRAFT_443575 [Podospora didyma]|uniref:Uncharacterized protein n=1 Tax=Podospora didyma TaxID=330526 RepID=A0AAE0P4V6_9PEZI|nr:hypothetical protein B0H63DRAFT_443575 [Podospora didyma]
MAYLWSKLGSLTWGPGLSVVRPAIQPSILPSIFPSALFIQSLFAAIEVGTLLLVDEPAGQRSAYGQKLTPSKLDNLTISHSLETLTNGVKGSQGYHDFPRRACCQERCLLDSAPPALKAKSFFA